MDLSFPQIETARLLLRPPLVDDAEVLSTIWSDPEVTKFIPIILFRTRDEIKEFIPVTLERWEERGFGMFSVMTKKDGAMIGYCGLQFLNGSNEVEIYYGFSKEAWDNGFATEAARAVLRFGFEEVKLEHIAGVTQPENAASQKVLEKIGLERHAENRKFYDNECAYFTASRKDYSPDEAFYSLTYGE
jgi:ribosomal-protein-alanine N-acetyltransferase